MTIETYTEAICYLLPIDSWEAFVLDANETGRYEFFPKLHDLRRDIDDERATRTAIKGLLPSDTRTPEQKKADAVETSRRLREIIQQTAGVNVDMPKWPGEREPYRVRVTDSRLEELRRQAEQLKAETAPEVVKS